MSEHTMEKSIAEQMLDWAERLDKRFYAFDKQSLYNWLIVKAPRVAELEQFNVGLDGLSKLQDEAFAQLEAALDKRLRQEYMDEDHRLGGIGITYEQFKTNALLTVGDDAKG